MKLLLAPLSAVLTLGCFHVAIRDGHGGSTVNASISVPPGSQLAGGCRSVNGSVRVGEGSSTRRISTVNGSIRVGADCTIEDDISSVNGGVTCGSRTRIRGGIDTVNGRIELEQAQVHQDITTVNGDIHLDGGRVEGDIVIKGRSSRWGNAFGRPLVIKLTGGAEVLGQVRVRDEDREVEVRLSPDSRVHGGVGRARTVKL